MVKVLRNQSTQLAISIVFAELFGLAIYYSVHLTFNKYVMSVIGGVLFFLVCMQFLMEEKGIMIKISSLLLTRIWSVSILAFPILFLASFYLTRGYASSLFEPWQTIGHLQAMQGALSILVTLFLPGHLILTLLKFDEEPCAKFAWSVITSFLVTPLVFLVLFLFHGLDYWCFVITVFDISLACLVLIKNTYQTNRYFFLCTEHLILIVASVMQILLAFSIMTYNFPLIPPDGWVRHGQMLAFAEGKFPYPTIGGITEVYEPWWLYPLLASAYLPSNLPPINMMQMLQVLNMVPVFAFYTLLKRSFPNYRRFHGMGIVLAATGGFGSLIALSGMCPNYFSYLSAGNTYLALRTIETKVFYWSPWFFALPSLSPLHILGLSTFLLLMSLISSDIASENRPFVIAFLAFACFAVGFLGHFYDPLVLLGLLLILCIFGGERMKKTSCVQYAFLAAFAFSFLIDTIFPGSYYVNPFSTLGVLVLVMGRIALFASRFLKLPANSKNRLKRAVHDVKFLAVICVSYVYMLSLIIYMYLFNSLNVNLNVFLPAFTTTALLIPWYIYPIIIGGVGIFSLVGMFSLRLKDLLYGKFSPFFWLLILMLIAIVSQRVLPLLEEHRMVSFAWVSLVVFATRGLLFLRGVLTKIGSHYMRRPVKTMLVLVIVFLTLFSGLLSNYYVVEQYSMRPYYLFSPNVTDQDLEALEFIRSEYKTGNSVLTISYPSNRLLIGFASISFAYVLSSEDSHLFMARPFFSAKYPETILYLLARENVQFIYLRSSDQNVYAKRNSLKEGSLFQHFFQYLPIVFRNDEALVYGVGKVYPPSPTNSNVDILLKLPSKSSLTEARLLYEVSKLGASYSIDRTGTSYVSSNVKLLVIADEIWDEIGHDLLRRVSLNKLTPTVLIMQTTTGILLNVLEETNSSIIADDDQVDFWTVSGWERGNYRFSISNETTIAKKGSNSLRIVLGDDGTYASPMMYHDYDPTEDWSSRESVHLWWYGANTNTKYRVYIYGPNTSNYKGWDFADVPNGWRMIYIPLNRLPHASSGTLDLSRVCRVLISAVTPDCSGTTYLDRIVVDVEMEKDQLGVYLGDEIAVHGVDFCQYSNPNIEFEGMLNLSTSQLGFYDKKRATYSIWAAEPNGFNIAFNGSVKLLSSQRNPDFIRVLADGQYSVSSAYPVRVSIFSENRQDIVDEQILGEGVNMSGVSHIQLEVSSPEISADGVTRIHGYNSIGSYVFAEQRRFVDADMKFSGKISFDLRSDDELFIFDTMDTAYSSVETYMQFYTRSEPYFTDLNVPWIKIFSSPVHILALIMLLVLAFTARRTGPGVPVG